MTEPKTFALQYTPGPGWVQGRSIYEQDLMAHAEYMERMHAAGRILLAGPFSDSSGGMCVVRLNNEAEAEKFIADDPAISSGVFTAQIRPWHVVFEK